MPTHRYRIVVSGALGKVGRDVFWDLRVESNGTNTALTGEYRQEARNRKSVMPEICTDVAPRPLPVRPNR